jgi:glucose-1-phosphate cytidylyltransferase
MIMVADKPLIWHIMRCFANYGVTRFILALGENGNQFRDYFIDYSRYCENFTIRLGSADLSLLTRNEEAAWEITFIETGTSAATGARVSRCEKYVKSDEFFVTYSDCLSNVNLRKLWEYHQHKGRPLTVTGVRPPFRSGEFEVDGDEPVGFREKSVLVGSRGWINGGFMACKREFFRSLSPLNECTLEREVFRELVEGRNLAVYQHSGYWQYIDTERDIREINDLHRTNQQPWVIPPD